MRKDMSATRVGRLGRGKICTKYPYDAYSVPSAPKNGRTRLRVASDLDSELETNREEDKRDG